MKIANTLAALLCTLLISSASIAATAKEQQKEPDATSDAIPEPSLEFSWDQPMAPAEEAQVEKSLRDTFGEILGKGDVNTFKQLPDGHGQYPW
jgi:hypothetical protein